MIPKKIHYCWFGGNSMPELAKKCIRSWEKYFPGYEIIEWNESNFDVNCCAYVSEAYNAKKYAFVSDYARFEILYREGGLYFDTDVEVIRSFSDILERGGFMGIEKLSSDLGICVAPGLGLAVNPGLELYKELIEGYHNRHFMNSDGTLNQKTVVEYTSECLIKHGMQFTNEVQEVAGVWIYPKEYFCPIDYETGVVTITGNTRSIHHYMATWQSQEDVMYHKLMRKYTKCLGRNLGSYVAKTVAVFKYRGIKGVIESIQRFVNK